MFVLSMGFTLMAVGASGTCLRQARAAAGQAAISLPMPGPGNGSATYRTHEEAP
jgi:hypothetical protein